MLDSLITPSFTLDDPVVNQKNNERQTREINNCPPKPLPTKFQSWQDVGAYCRTHQAYPVVEKQENEYVLVDSFSHLKNAQDFISGTHYLIWYTPDDL